MTEMSPSIADHSAAAPTTVPAGRTWFRRLGMAVLNCWLCYHLFAIVVCPASVEPATPLAQSGWTLVSGYVQLLYLNHGFHFFAPDPAGSSLVEYTLEFADGTTQTDRLPNRRIQPRLLYHRHFMLTEFLGNGPEEFRPLVERAMARQLIRSTGAVRVQLKHVYHDTASVTDVLAGKSLNEPGLFSIRELGAYGPDDLGKPFVPTVIAPAASTLADTASGMEASWNETEVTSTPGETRLTPTNR